jgi:hypothetical protein
MCVLTIKREQMFNPLCTKLCIIALGNHKDRIWTKSEKYAPVLHIDLMQLITSLVVEKRRMLKLGNCKNTFCQGILPNDKITIIKPPIGDPDAKKDEYWLLQHTIYGQDQIHPLRYRPSQECFGSMSFHWPRI